MEHLCKVIAVFELQEHSTGNLSPSVLAPRPTKTAHCTIVQIDPDNLLPEEGRAKFQALLKKYYTLLYKLECFIEISTTEENRNWYM